MHQPFPGSQTVQPDAGLTKTDAAPNSACRPVPETRPAVTFAEYLQIWLAQVPATATQPRPGKPLR